MFVNISYQKMSSMSMNAELYEYEYESAALPGAHKSLFKVKMLKEKNL